MQTQFFRRALAIPAFFAILSLAAAQLAPPFQDVTLGSGIVQVPSPKFGGPCVADIDGDGIYDLVLTYHANEPMQVYFGTPSGRFELSPFRIAVDIHGVAVGQISTRSPNRLMVVSVGGGKGENLRPPRIFRFSGRDFVEVTDRLGFGGAGGRGRVALFTDLSMQTRNVRVNRGGGPDILVINFLGGERTDLRNFAFRNNGRGFRLRATRGFTKELENRGELTDIDGDGVMELISFRDFKIYKLTSPFRYRDATNEFFFRNPIPAEGRSISSVAEIDFDNDGDMDLYVARTDNTLISFSDKIPNDDFSDILLENRNGRYFDVSVQSRIPRGTNTMGVTTGDFNNDGFTDIMLSIWDAPDILLMNNRDRTFSGTSGMFPRLPSERGDHAVAVDYDMDGRVDIIIGRGAQRDFRGTYRIMKNFLQLTPRRRYLLVRVGSSPSGGATALHASVTVFMNGRRLTRRVGSPGAQAGGVSYLDTVHFGLGFASSVTRVRVIWTTGESRSRRNVASNQRISIGTMA